MVGEQVAAVDGHLGCETVGQQPDALVEHAEVERARPVGMADHTEGRESRRGRARRSSPDGHASSGRAASPRPNQRGPLAAGSSRRTSTQVATTMATVTTLLVFTKLTVTLGPSMR